MAEKKRRKFPFTVSIDLDLYDKGYLATVFQDLMAFTKKHPDLVAQTEVTGCK